MPTLPPGFKGKPGAYGQGPFGQPGGNQQQTLPGPSQVTGPVNNNARVLLESLRGGASMRGGPQTMTNQMGGNLGGGQGSLGQQAPGLPQLPPGFQGKPPPQAQGGLMRPSDAMRPGAPVPQGNPQRPTDPRAMMNVLRSQAGRQAMGGGNPQQPQQMQTTQQQPPPNQQNAGLQQQFNQQQAQQQAASQDQNASWESTVDSAPSWLVTDAGKELFKGNVGGAVDEAGAAAGGIAGDAGAVAGGIAGEGVAGFVDAYENANPASAAGYGDFLNTPGFEQGSLMGDVGQNWTAAMDPAAWEQMAQNRLASANEANMGALNRGERRLADRAGRTGFANTGGATSQMYNDYAGRGVQAERDIFNDTLMNQMNALQGASGFALGENAQNLGQWGQLYGGSLHQADQDFAANREDNPSGAAMLSDLFGAGGAAVGGAGQLAGAGAGGLMSLLAIPGMAAMLGGM
jgi:hypothetical protein